MNGRCIFGRSLLGLMVLAVGLRSATLEVSGLGWWENRETALNLKRMLEIKPSIPLTANGVEDAVFITLNSLREQGYLRPEVIAHLQPVNGAKADYTFDLGLSTYLPRPLEVEKLVLEAKPGRRYQLTSVSFSGLGEVKEEVARAFFLAAVVPLFGADERAYSSGRLDRAVGALTDEYLIRGYRTPTATVAGISIDESRGEVSVHVNVVPGIRSQVESVTVHGVEGTTIGQPPGRGWSGRPWTNYLRQDIVEAYRQAAFRAGYPDVQVTVTSQEIGRTADVRQMALDVGVVPGPQVRVGDLRFEGNLHTKTSVMAKRVRLDSGDLFNPAELERGRYRLGRLGVFSRVKLRSEEAGDQVRDIIFTVDERPLWDASVMAGWGSYEQLRVGVEVQHRNLWQRAHSSRLTLVESLKSSRGDYRYTVPEIFGANIDGNIHLSGLYREELAFTREEYGISLGLRWRWAWLRADVLTGYSYEYLRNGDNLLSGAATADNSATVGSINIGISADHRDNPLRPRRGWRWFMQVENASTALGGSVDYQKGEAGVSWHKGLGSGLFLHTALTHGVILTLGAPDDSNLPVNTRFYPGGDSSIRGYQQGEAAPRAPDGNFIGAKTYTLLNIEFEQALVGEWTLVAFFDGLGASERLGDYPWKEPLYSAGLGLRYQTIVGPIRLEYGRNLNPRVEDPSGTLHFALGFPF